MKKYKIVFLDLDGTLINTLNNEPFPRGIWDMKLNFKLLYKLRELSPDYIFIVTNQGGIEKGYVDRKHFENKLRYVVDCVTEYMGKGCICKYTYCHTNSKDSNYRKPNTGMLEYSLSNYTLNYDYFIDKEYMCMIGDASGKEGQFSDSDKQTAINFGIDYYDVDDFIKMEL